MRNLLQDLRFAVRQLRKSPGFALTTIVTLALGIGATTAMFSLINTVLLRPLPFPEPDRLMIASPIDRTAVKSGVPTSISYPDFFDWRSRQHSFDAIASYHRESHTLTGQGSPRSWSPTLFLRISSVCWASIRCWAAASFPTTRNASLASRC